MKSLTIRLTLVLMLCVAAAGTFAQEGEPSADETTATQVDETSPHQPEAANSYQIRDSFREILSNNPSELSTILALDPALLSNREFLAVYPDLERFVTEHPQVRHNPRFYIGESHRDRGIDNLLESLAIFSSFLLIAFAFAWLVRTFIEQKRWNRLSQIQTEVHNKILDRFGTSEELMEYIRTPAGTRFLESAPIPLYAEENPDPSMNRIMWSIQIGVVIAAGALGMLLVSGQFEAESAEGFYALGMIALCLGVGFVASAFVSMLFSKKLGSWKGSGETVGHGLD